MTKDKNGADNNPIGVQTAKNRKFVLAGQFVRDLSFENPRGPVNIFNLKKAPDIDMDIQLRINKLQEETSTYEVIQDINVSAKSENEVIFMVELSYSGIVSLNKELTEDQVKDTLLYDCPQYIYPFSRRVIADATRDGGFPPLMLDPIDFRAIGIKSSEKIENIA